MSHIELFKQMAPPPPPTLRRLLQRLHCVIIPELPFHWPPCNNNNTCNNRSRSQFYAAPSSPVTSHPVAHNVQCAVCVAPHRQRMSRSYPHPSQIQINDTGKGDGVPTNDVDDDQQRRNEEVAALHGTKMSQQEPFPGLCQNKRREYWTTLC